MIRSSEVKKEVGDSGGVCIVGFCCGLSFPGLKLDGFCVGRI